MPWYSAEIPAHRRTSGRAGAEHLHIPPAAAAGINRRKQVEMAVRVLAQLFLHFSAVGTALRCLPERTEILCKIPVHAQDDSILSPALFAGKA